MLVTVIVSVYNYIKFEFLIVLPMIRFVLLACLEMGDLAFREKLFTQILLWREMYSRLVQIRHLYNNMI